jgi:hypothetical protein
LAAVLAAEEVPGERMSHMEKSGVLSLVLRDINNQYQLT